jgi:hypothetical protein
MVLTGRPAQLESTNFTGQNKVFILDLANQRLGAPGKSKYVVRDLVKTSGANQAGTPPNTLLK